MRLALAIDNRFKVIASPRLRECSGTISRLVVDQYVPALGAVTNPQVSSAPILSVEYCSPDVIFDLRPTECEDGVELSIDQQLSNFVQTGTGVIESLTFTSWGMTSYEVIVLVWPIAKKQQAAVAHRFFGIAAVRVWR